jgi:hypothetical protein
MTLPTIPAPGSSEWLNQEARSGLMQSIALQQAYDAVIGAEMLRQLAGEITPAEEALIVSWERYVRTSGEFPGSAKFNCVNLLVWSGYDSVIPRLQDPVSTRPSQPPGAVAK